MKPRILYIEPDADFAYPVQQILQEEGFDVFWIENPGLLTDTSTEPDADLVIFGADADHVQIRKLLAWKMRWPRQTPLLVISCYCFKYEALSYLGRGVSAVLVKPFELTELAQKAVSMLPGGMPAR